MDKRLSIGDIVNLGKLRDEGYRPLWDRFVGTKDEVRVFHHPELYYDVRVVRDQTMPEIYKVEKIYVLKALRAEMRFKDYK